MRTTVTLDEALVGELLRLTRQRTKTSAVAWAVREQIRLAKLRQLAGILGSVDIDEDAVRSLRVSDPERSRWMEKSGGDRDE